MNYFLLIYPIISLGLFISVLVFAPIIFLAFLVSPLLLLLYMENPGRTRTSDIVSLVILVFSLVSVTFGALSYVISVLIPVIILYLCRVYYQDKVYLPAVLSPLPGVLIAVVMLFFVPAFNLEAHDSLLQAINSLTAPIASSPERFENMGMISYLMANKERSVEYIIKLTPAILFVSISLPIFICDRSIPIMKDSKRVVRDYRLPDYYVWALIAGGFLILFKVEAFKFISYSVLGVFCALYFYQGASTLGIVFDRIKLPRIMRVLVYVFFYTEPPILLIVSLFGLSNIWFRPKWTIREEDAKQKKL